MSDHIIILAGILGIDVNSQADSKFLAYCIKDIENVDMFIDYCNDYKESVTFSKKNERLNTLANRFKKLEAESKLLESREASKTYASELAEKVSNCVVFIEDNYLTIDKLVGIKVEKERYFEDHHIRALKEVGSIMVVVELSKTHKLEGAIIKEYMKAKKKKASYAQLTDNEKKMKALVNKASS